MFASVVSNELPGVVTILIHHHHLAD